jgi:hypothetical protein
MRLGKRALAAACVPVLPGALAGTAHASAVSRASRVLTADEKALSGYAGQLTWAACPASVAAGPAPPPATGTPR